MVPKLKSYSDLHSIQFKGIEYEFDTDILRFYI